MLELIDIHPQGEPLIPADGKGFLIVPDDMTASDSRLHALPTARHSLDFHALGHVCEPQRNRSIQKPKNR